jgi:hypothetical protein
MNPIHANGIGTSLELTFRLVRLVGAAEGTSPRIDAFRFVLFAGSEPERTTGADIADTVGSPPRPFVQGRQRNLTLMDTAVWVALITSTTSLAVAATSLWFQRKTAREAREEQRRSDAKVVLDKYRGPLLQAGSELGHRINNIRHDNFLSYATRGTSREMHARRTTQFRFAQYFGWREVLRTEVRLLRFEREGDTRLVAALIGDIDWAFATDKVADRHRGMLWSEEQRGIGELMVVRSEDGASTCRGYATFASEYEKRFEPWMDQVTEYVFVEGAASHRLRLVQWALLGLVTQLDEEGVHTDAKWMSRARDELKEAAAPNAPRVELSIRSHADGKWIAEP